MATQMQLEVILAGNRARGRQRKRESGRQASEAQRRQGCRTSDKKPKETFFLVGRTT